MPEADVLKVLLVDELANKHTYDDSTHLISCQRVHTYQTEIKVPLYIKWLLYYMHLLYM